MWKVDTIMVAGEIVYKVYQKKEKDGVDYIQYPVNSTFDNEVMAQELADKLNKEAVK